MMVVIRIYGTDATPFYDTTTYLKRYDPQVHYSHDQIELTGVKDDAQKFEDFAAALSLWKTPSRVVPRRRDGKPNRPLSAFTIEVERA